MTTATKPREATSPTKPAAFAADRKAFLAVAAVAARAVSGRSSMPILSHLLLTAERDTLTVRGYDLELGASARCPAEVTTPGALCVPANRLVSLLSALRGDTVRVSPLPGHSAEVKCGKSRHVLLGLPAEEYPNWPDMEGGTRLDVETTELRRILESVQGAVSTDEGRPVICGAHLTASDGELLAIATDTHRLHVASIEADVPSLSAIVPARGVRELIFAATHEGKAMLAVTSKAVHAWMPGEEKIEIVCRLIDGQYPNWKRPIPAVEHTRAVLDVAELKSAARLALMAAEGSHRIIFRLATTGAEVTAQSSFTGEAQEEIGVTLTGPDITIALNGKYLQQMLAACPTDTVAFGMTEPLKPALVKPIASDGSEAPGWFGLLMPMQIV